MQNRRICPFSCPSPNECPEMVVVVTITIVIITIIIILTITIIIYHTVSIIIIVIVIVIIIRVDDGADVMFTLKYVLRARSTRENALTAHSKDNKKSIKMSD